MAAFFASYVAGRHGSRRLAKLLCRAVGAVSGRRRGRDANEPSSLGPPGGPRAPGAAWAEGGYGTRDSGVPVVDCSSREKDCLTLPVGRHCGGWATYRRAPADCARRAPATPAPPGAAGASDDGGSRDAGLDEGRMGERARNAVCRGSGWCGRPGTGVEGAAGSVRDFRATGDCRAFVVSDR